MNSYTTVRPHTRSTLNRRKSLPLLALCIAVATALSLSGCVGLTGAGTPAGKSSPGTPSGTLAASATSLSFGNVMEGSNSSQNLTLTNTGTASLTISQATVTGSGFNIAGGMSSMSIAAGQNHTIQVQFAPASPGNVAGSIVIASDATDSSLGISLSGNGIASVSITTQPASQSVTAGQTATFSVVATGSGTLTYQWKKNGAVISGAT
ncbi:MAG TPA: choice-of-anchor D domain-containing protein, partial [Candidatus Acidoferrales bacterium]|nr:choice-of-anchor D domain-containing protein [Candidatus Acidoferrales bacterium]